ncbi:MAG: lipid II flippase MurJ [Candidatus Avelusimicrobium sp.]|uniref:lipid II flippase MurJ n=1 Tax=Candidatus Avelusimicrobium sp. TaxID=3048833 RepID=UPI003F08107E
MVHLFKPTSYRGGAAMAVGATLAWKIVSFANALLVALYFGADRATDVYFYLIMATGFGLTFLQRMNAAAVIPEAMTLDAQTTGGGRPLLNGFLYFYLLITLALGAAGIFFPVKVMEALSLFSIEELVRERNLLTWSFWMFGLQLLTAYLIAVLEMYRRFASSLFTPLNALLPLACLVLLGRTEGIVSMVYGFVAANAVQIIVFLWILKKELSWNFFLQPKRPSHVFVKNLISNQLIELANIAAGVLPLYLLSGLSAGLVSALNYAKQLAESPTEILTLRVTNVSKIQLTESAAKNDTNQLNADFLSTLHFLLFLLTPLAVFTAFYAPEIVTLFFKRGEFDAQDVRQAAAFLRPLLGLMLFMGPILMQNNVVAAGRKLKEFLPYALSGIVLFIVLTPPSVRAWGAFAFPYVQVGCCFVGLYLNYLFFSKYCPYISYGPSLRRAARLLAVNVIALFPSAVYAFFGAGTNPFVTVLIGGVIFLAGLFWLTRRSGDWDDFLRQLFERV